MIFVVFTGAYLFTMAVVDLITHTLPIKGLLVGMVMVIISFFPPMISKEETVYLTERLWGLLPGLCLLVCSYISRGQIGAGDGILCMLLGAATGFFLVCSVLLSSLLLVAVYCVVLMPGGTLRTRKRIAFVPFLFLGFMLTLIAI